MVVMDLAASFSIRPSGQNGRSQECNKRVCFSPFLYKIIYLLVGLRWAMAFDPVLYVTHPLNISLSLFIFGREDQLEEKEEEGGTKSLILKGILNNYQIVAFAERNPSWPESALLHFSAKSLILKGNPNNYLIVPKRRVFPRTRWSGRERPQKRN
jgi:hypothetical protein